MNPAHRIARHRHSPWKILVLLLVAGSAGASITIIYSGTSSQTLGVKPVPLVFEVGADGGVSDYVTSLSITTNKTSFAASVKGVPEASVVIGDVVHLHNVDARTHTFTLSAPQNTNALATTYKIDWFDGATNVGTLDFKAASPSVTVANLAVGKVLTGQLTIVLASGAGANNVADTAVITTSVSS